VKFLNLFSDIGYVAFEYRMAIIPFKQNVSLWISYEKVICLSFLFWIYFV